MDWEEMKHGFLCRPSFANQTVISKVPRSHSIKYAFPFKSVLTSKGQSSPAFTPVRKMEIHITGPCVLQFLKYLRLLLKFP